MSNEPLKYGCCYHIYNRGNNGENLFTQRRNFPYFLKLYSKYIQPIAETFAYCLLPNHFHFALRTYSKEEQEAYFYEQIGPISKIGPILNEQPIFKLQTPSRAFNNMFIAYTRAFNKATHRTGALFERPFHRKIVDNQHYFMNLITYIHRNPQQHGFTDDFRNWAWSSYGGMLSEQATKLKRDAVLGWYNGRIDFIDAHAAEQDTQKIAPLLLDDWF